MASFSILITTKNRKIDLVFTLLKIKDLLNTKEVICIICDDGSTDDTSSFVRTNYPNIQLIQNPQSKGLIYSRNRLMNLVITEFAISIDDDAHFITKYPLAKIKYHFDKNTNCGLIALRIFWGLDEPNKTESGDKSHRVQGFVGCAHVWRMETWRSIPNYPDWFIFYGEEDFASYQLFKKGWEIHYLPEVLVNHRVDLKARKNNADYTIRLRRSLRAGCYLFFLFFPPQKIPRKMVYSMWMQLKLKVFRGDMKALQAISLVLLDLVLAIPKIMQNSNRLTLEEYDTYQKLPETQIYWEPEN